MWEVDEASAGRLALVCSSFDGEMGFPGALETRVEYRVEGTEIRIGYRATTSAPTIVNLTNHTCWNLAGEGSGSVDNHVLQVAASAYTPVDAHLIPTGEIASVDGTPLDFRNPVAIGARGRGYDDNFVLDHHDGALVLAARVTDPASGRALDVLTTEPGVQLHTGTFLDGASSARAGGRTGEATASRSKHSTSRIRRTTRPSRRRRSGRVRSSSRGPCTGSVVRASSGRRPQRRDRRGADCC